MNAAPGAAPRTLGTDTPGASSEPARPNAGQRLEVELDARGAERSAGEVLMVANAAALPQLRLAGFEPLSTTQLVSTGQTLVRAKAPEGGSVETSLSALRRAFPKLLIATNAIYRPAVGQANPGGSTPARAEAKARGVLGVIDTGADLATAQLRGRVLQARGFSRRGYTPDEHGTWVAAIAAAQGPQLMLADVFEADQTGAPAASVEAIVRAIDWLVAGRVPVINISVAGPDNPILQAVVRRAAASGVVIVAAAGNGGPTAAPVYPAAYEGVVAVTAVDVRDRPYWKANRGRYISFAAPGVAIPLNLGAQRLTLSGTSFSAPIVAAAVAAQMDRPSPKAAAQTLLHLRATAHDLGKPGWDPVYGWGRIRP